MNDKDQIKDLFSQKLGGYEAKVNPELWTNIASQVGAAAAASSAATGMSLLTKTIIGLSAAGVLTTGVVLFNSSDDSAEKKTEITTTPSERITKVENVSNEAEVISNSDVVEITQLPERNNANIANGNDPQLNQVPALANGPISMGTAGQIDGVFGNQGQNDDSAAVNSFDPILNGPVNPPTAGLIDEPVPSTTLPVNNPSDQLHEEDDPTKVAAIPEETLAPLEFELPNIFSPNNDGVNDEFFFNELPDNLSSFSFVVQDQMGATVFVSDNPDFKWDGRNMYTGEKVKKGIHAYVVIAEDELGRSFKSTQYLMITTD